MTSQITRSVAGFAAFALLLFVGTAMAQQAATHDHDHAAAAQAPSAPVGPGMQPGQMGAMGVDRQNMMAEMNAADQKLDELVTKMNAARGGDRLDAVVAVVNQLVDAHKKMRAHMESMHGGMMMMMGEHANHPAEK
jgi:hypothetical protein